VFHKHPNAKGWTFPDKLKDGRDNNCRNMVDVGTKFEIIFKNYNMDNKLIIAIIDDDIFQFIGKNLLNHLNL
jgi:hypothetical protein